MTSIRELYESAKRGPIPTRSISSDTMNRLRVWMKANEVAVVTEFGRLLHIETGVYSERMGEPALEGRGQPLHSNSRVVHSNCVNCGAPRQPAMGTCDYCGTEQ